MSEERLKVKKYAYNPEWDFLEITSRHDTWQFESHSDGDVEISVSSGRESLALFLSQTELKQVIEFLQSRVK